MKNTRFPIRRLAVLISMLCGGGAPAVWAVDCVNSWNNEDALVIPAMVFSDGRLYALTLTPKSELNDSDNALYTAIQTQIADPGCTPTASYDTRSNGLTVHAIQDLYWDGPANAVMDATFQLTATPSADGSIDYALTSYRMKDVTVYLDAYMGRTFSNVKPENFNIDGSPLTVKARNLILPDKNSAFIVSTYPELPSAFQIRLSFYDSGIGQIQTYKASVTHYNVAENIAINPLTTLVSSWLERHPEHSLREAEWRVRTLIDANESDPSLGVLGSMTGWPAFDPQIFQQQSDRSGGLDKFIARLLGEMEQGQTHLFRSDVNASNSEGSDPQALNKNTASIPVVSAEIYPPAHSGVSDRVGYLLQKAAHAGTAIIDQIFPVTHADDTPTPPSDPALVMAINNGQELGKIFVKAVFNKDGFWQGGIPSSYADLTLLAVDFTAKVFGLDQNIPEGKLEKIHKLLKSIDAKMDTMQKDVDHIATLSRKIYTAVSRSDYENVARPHLNVFSDFDLARKEISRAVALKNGKAQSIDDQNQQKDEIVKAVAEFNRLMEKKGYGGTVNHNYIAEGMRLGFLNDSAVRGLITLYNNYIYAGAFSRGYFNIEDEARLWSVLNYWQARQSMALEVTMLYKMNHNVTDKDLTYLVNNTFKKGTWDEQMKLMPKDRLSEACPLVKHRTEPSKWPSAGCFLDFKNMPDQKHPLMWWPQAGIDPRFIRPNSAAPMNYFKDATDSRDRIYMADTAEHQSSDAASSIQNGIKDILSKASNSATLKFLDWVVPRKEEWTNMMKTKMSSIDGRKWLVTLAGDETGLAGLEWGYLRELFLAAQDASSGNPSSYFDDIFKTENMNGAASIFKRAYPAPMININQSPYDFISFETIYSKEGGSSSCGDAGARKRTAFCTTYRIKDEVAFVPVRRVTSGEQYYIAPTD